MYLSTKIPRVICFLMWVYSKKRSVKNSKKLRTPFLMQLLLSETELLNDSSVSLDVNLLEVVEEVSSVTNHLEETTAAMIVLVVALEMLGEVSYSVGKDSDLNLGRTCVTLVSCVLFDNCLLFCCCHFRIHLSKIKYFCKYELHRNREGEIHAFGYLGWSFTGVTCRDFY